MADEKIKADQTFKHTRMGSHFSSGVLNNEAEFDGAPPRRKTVGFRETRRDANAVSGFIAIEDVESMQSHSIFERAQEDLDLQKSIVKEQSPSQTGHDEDPGAPQPDVAAPNETAQFHPKPADESETPMATTDQQAPEPAEEDHDEENTNLLGLEDQEAQQLLNYGRSASTHKVTRERRRSGKNSVTNNNVQKSNNYKTFDLTSNLMQMNDLDFEELLECAEENIENSAFFASSVQLMGIIDGTISAIDERLTKKKARIINLPSTVKNADINQRLLTPKVH